MIVVAARAFSRRGRHHDIGDEIEVDPGEAVNLLQREHVRTLAEHHEHLERERQLRALDKSTRAQLEAARAEAERIAAQKVDAVRERFDREHRELAAQLEQEQREGRIEVEALEAIVVHDVPGRRSAHVNKGERLWLTLCVFHGLALRGLVRAPRDHDRLVREAEAAVREREREQLRALAETEPAARRALAAVEGAQ